MTDVHAAVMLRLFGEVQLLVDGTVWRGRAAQPRRLALLCILARAPGRMAHRDRLVDMVWGAHQPEAGRRLLNESLYVVRRELGANVIRTVGEQLVLDDAVACDVDAFEVACRTNDAETAVSLYGVPVFGDLNVDDAPTFTDWVTRERQRLAKHFAAMVPIAATSHLHAGRYADAAESYARLSLVEPFSLMALEGEVRALLMLRDTIRAADRLDEFERSWHDAFGADMPVLVVNLRRDVEAIGRTEGAQAKRTLPNVAKVVAVVLAMTLVAMVWWWSRPLVEPLDAAAPPSARRVVIVSRTVTPGDTALSTLRDALTAAVTNQLSVNAFGVASHAEAQAVERGRITLDSLIVLKNLGTIIELAFEARRAQLRVTARVLDATTRAVRMQGVFEQPFAEAMRLEPTLVQFSAESLRRRLRQPVVLRDSTEASRDATARKLLIAATRIRADALEVLRSGFRYDEYAIQRQLLSADTLLQRAQRMEPDWIPVLVERALMWQARATVRGGDAQRLALYDSARMFVDSVLVREPDHATALAVRGELWMRRMFFEVPSVEDSLGLQRADADLRRAVVLDPERAETWLALSVVQELRGQVAASRVSAQRAITQDLFLVDGEGAYFTLFANAISSQRFAEALRWCHRGRMVYPASTTFYECELTLMRDRPAEPGDDAAAWALVATLDSLSSLPHRTPRPPYALPYRLVLAAGVSARAGNVTRARAGLRRAQALVARDSTQRLDFAFDEPWVHLMLGDRARAVTQLRALVTQRPSIRRYLPSTWCYRSVVDEVLDVTPSDPTR